MALRFPLPVKRLKIRMKFVLDSLGTVVVGRNWGEEVFPGFSTAVVESFQKGDVTPQRTADMQLVEEGTLYINCGEGLLDHHPHDKHPGECAFTKMLTCLGLRDRLEFQKVLRYIRWDDVRDDRYLPEGGIPGPEEGSFLWGPMIKDVCDDLPVSGDFLKDTAMYEQAFVDCLQWFEPVFLRRVRRENVFHTEGAAAFKDAWVEDIRAGDGYAYKVAICVTDKEKFATYARWKGCSLIVQINESVVLPGKGEVRHFQIISDERAELNLSRLMTRLQEEELRVQGVPLREELRDRLGQEGSHPQIPELYYLRKKGGKGSDTILVGSRQTRDAPGSRIPPEDLQDIVRVWFKEDVKDPPGDSCKEWLSRWAPTVERPATVAAPSLNGAAPTAASGEPPSASGGDKPLKKQRIRRKGSAPTSPPDAAAPPGTPEPPPPAAAVASPATGSDQQATPPTGAP